MSTCSDTPSKRCTTCGESKPATTEFFHSNKGGLYDLRGQCKVCHNAQLRKTIPDNIPQGHKRCPRCKNVYPATHQFFHGDRRTKDGLVSSCKNCTNTTNKHVLVSLPIPEGGKRCLKCGEVRPATIEYFPIGSYGQRNYCRQCINAQARVLYRKRHPERECLPVGYKRCSMCKEVKPATRQYFYIANSTRQQMHSKCKKCTTIYNQQLYSDRTRYIPYPDGALKQCTSCKQMLPATPQYFYERRIFYGGLSARCRACLLRASKDHYQQTPSIIHASGKVKICVRCKRGKPATPDFFHVKRDGLYGLVAICKDCKCSYDRRYLQAHIEGNRAKYHRRRARLRSSGGNYTTEDIRQQYKRQKGRCYYCRHKLTKRHIEHVIPLSRGGSNSMSNIVLACPTCNLRKGNKYPHEWPQGGRLM